MSLNGKILPTTQILEEAIDELDEYSQSVAQHDTFSLRYFEGVAKMRFALVVVAELLHAQMEKKEQRTFTREASHLLERAKECCLSLKHNTEDAGPGIFLVKQIFKLYGKAFLTTLTSDRAKEWVVPAHLRRSDEVSFVLI